MPHHARPKHPNTPRRPGAPVLIRHILRGAFADGMQWAGIAATGLIVTLYLGGYPYYGAVAGLLAAGMFLAGLWRGCAAWQQELGAYRRALAIYRYQQLRASRDYTIPGFVPFSSR